MVWSRNAPKYTHNKHSTVIQITGDLQFSDNITILWRLINTYRKYYYFVSWLLKQQGFFCTICCCWWPAVLNPVHPHLHLMAGGSPLNPSSSDSGQMVTSIRHNIGRTLISAHRSALINLHVSGRVRPNFHRPSQLVWNQCGPAPQRRNNRINTYSVLCRKIPIFPGLHTSML